MRKSLILMLGLMVFIFSAAPNYAYAGKHKVSVKSATHELKETKEILGKLSPDADGHIAKASQDVDQALQELAAVKEEKSVKS
jgi:hypothetical protein